MGYGYGVWLIIDDDRWTKTKHVPHVTIACFMTYEDAYAEKIDYDRLIDLVVLKRFDECPQI